MPVLCFFPFKVGVILGWVVSIAVNWALLMALVSYYEDEVLMTPQWLAELYFTAGRTAWALTCAWIAYACLTGWGGKENIHIHTFHTYQLVLIGLRIDADM